MGRRALQVRSVFGGHVQIQHYGRGAAHIEPTGPATTTSASTSLPGQRVSSAHQLPSWRALTGAALLPCAVSLNHGLAQCCAGPPFISPHFTLHEASGGPWRHWHPSTLEHRDYVQGTGGQFQQWWHHWVDSGAADSRPATCRTRPFSTR